jgi:hypothetical protein
MAKYTKTVEAIQFLPKEDEKQHVEVIIGGASHVLHATDYAIYKLYLYFLLLNLKLNTKK